jgi:LmbE family N-acetylglucosaminyl deacetylase
VDGVEDLSMAPLHISPASNGAPLRVLCLGAHSDDIEIGCAATLLKWLADYPLVEITWVVFVAPPDRAAEARRSARALTRKAARLDLVLGDFSDTLLPTEVARAKAFLREVSTRVAPDVVFTHRLEDRHQDHRVVAELTWQTFRNHLVMEYEIPKYEGDLGQPNVFVPVSAAQSKRKVAHLMTHFGSQRAKDWFNEGSFNGLMALRGLECRAASGHAEAFHVRKLVL